MPRSIVHFSSARIILASILFALLCGTLLLKLPLCHSSGISWIDALFSATSCLCICGLSTVPFTSFTTFGQCVLLMLIQIGGLGLVTLTFFLMSFFVKFGFTTQVIAGQLMELETWKDIKKLIFFIITFTVSIELIGALLTFFSIYPDYSIPRALFLSLFHAVSTFCDAGISLFPQGMVTYKSHYMMLLIDSGIMIAAGLGFITWYELYRYAKSIYYKKRFHMSLQTNIVLSMTCALLLFSIVLYWMLERHNALSHLSPFMGFVNAIFNGVAIRGTGLATLNINQLQLATILLIMIMAFIGSAPGSTGSGIKVTTFAVFLATIQTTILGRTNVSIKGRSIAMDQVYKAISIVALGISWIVFTTFFLLIIENWPFLDILFEVVSAFATLGLSLGVTAQLSTLGKIFIIASMIVGRISTLTLLLAFYKKHEMPDFSYPEERIILG